MACAHVEGKSAQSPAFRIKLDKFLKQVGSSSQGDHGAESALQHLRTRVKMFVNFLSVAFPPALAITKLRGTIVVFALHLTLLALFFAPAVVLAHQINGTVLHPDGQPVQGTVSITCLNVSLEEQTDSRGSFSFFIKATGRCALSVGRAAYPVYSSQDPVRYDLVLENNALRRR
jgi:hypothetical protein